MIDMEKKTVKEWFEDETVDELRVNDVNKPDAQRAFHEWPGSVLHLKSGSWR